MKEDKKYEKPICEVVKFNTQSTTVLGNCTHWKGGGYTAPSRPGGPLLS